MSRPIVLIGWDGADRDMIEHLADAGNLPNVAALVESGRTATIVGLPGLGDHAHWETFAIGAPPGSHGQFHFLQTEPGTYKIAMFDREKEATVPFWETLADKGIASMVIDVPKAPVSRSMRVFEVSDWMAHGKYNAVPSTPADVGTLFDSPPGGEFDQCHRYDADLGAQKEHLSLLRRRLDHRGATLRRLLRNDVRPLTIAVYAEAHCAGHHYIHLGSPLTTEEMERRGHLGDPLPEMLQAMDHDLGELIKTLPEEADICLFSLAGMADTHHELSAIRAVVDRAEVDWRRRHPLQAASSRASRMKHRGAAVVPSALVFRVVPSATGTVAVRFNLHGREPRGLVRPRQLSAVVDWLTDALMSATNDAGERIVAEVLPSSVAYPGPNYDAHADLHVVPAPIRRTSDHSPIGNHTTNGWLIAPESLHTPPTVDVAGMAQLVEGWLT